jgi:hypothetical protein
MKNGIRYNLKWQSLNPDKVRVYQKRWRDKKKQLYNMES